MIEAADYKKQRVDLARKIKKLQDIDLFKEVILGAYMQDMELILTFEDTNEERDRLKAISNLNKWMNDIVNEAESLV